jgi:hypothetical protein
LRTKGGERPSPRQRRGEASAHSELLPVLLICQLADCRTHYKSSVARVLHSKQGFYVHLNIKIIIKRLSISYALWIVNLKIDL